MSILDDSILSAGELPFKCNIDIEGLFCFSGKSNNHINYCRGSLNLLDQLVDEPSHETIANQIKQRGLNVSISFGQIYERAQKLGLHYGPNFSLVKSASFHDQWVFGTVEVKTQYHSLLHYSNVLDACLHPALLFDNASATIVPTALESFKLDTLLLQQSEGYLISACQITSSSPNELLVNVHIFNAQFLRVGEIRQIQFSLLSKKDKADSIALVHTLDWLPQQSDHLELTSKFKKIAALTSMESSISEPNINIFKDLRELSGQSGFDLIIDFRPLQNPSLVSTLKLLQFILSQPFRGLPLIVAINSISFNNENEDTSSGKSIAGMVRCFRVETEVISGKKWPVVIVDYQKPFQNFNELIFDVIANTGSTLEDWHKFPEIIVNESGKMIKYVKKIDAITNTSHDVRWIPKDNQISKMSTQRIDSNNELEPGEILVSGTSFLIISN
jgi:hypothetical protein